MTLTDEEKTTSNGPAGLGVVGWLRWGWRVLTSMRTALILLFLLALASVPGSLYPQRGVDPGAVARYFENDPTKAEWLDRFFLFDVFTSPWFAAIYLLLFLSLIGCVLPRTMVHLKEMRRTPPPAPRNLARLPHHAEIEGDLASAEAYLRSKRWRVTTGDGWVSAEKGHLRETGNLLFHVALLVLLVAVGVGGLFGYRGNVLVIEGDGFANTVAAYDRYLPGSQVSPEDLQPFSFTLKDFQASYIGPGHEKQGQPLDYFAKLAVQDSPTAPEREFTLRVNEPLEADGALTYLIGHGYAPTFRITGGDGKVAFEGAVPCLVSNTSTYESECVIKVPDAAPDQLAFLGRFLPSTVPNGDQWLSVFPGAVNPTVQIWPFKGDLGLDAGIPQSVYDLGGHQNLKPLGKMTASPKPMAVGDAVDLPDGAGKIEFTGLKEWITLQTTYDPGRFPALLASGVAILGLLLSLLIHRRRVWVRVRDGGVTVGGLTRTEGGDFGEEFAELTKALEHHARAEVKDVS
ncbi:cytochrome c biogenesis protein ResB [Herbidospora galbida]|uniref:Cytochrome c biogenesis protein ResB n=1 Tax=Herbidospora galbida TaxID=2575442 RepID=A0A4U3MMD2_9ACTN|nr:cytochrome c biogenesis protein ResB [Herbidospora galbida]TKK89784.1 cytochrome c biogenesis protein ResB [Herbidospora galbida]